MASQAKLYEVEGQHGTVYVYALHDAQTGMLWTERTEKAARSLAEEKKLTIIEQLTISRRELLRLMGQEPIEEAPAPAPRPAAPSRPAATKSHQVPPPAPSSQPQVGGAWGGCKVVTGGSALPLKETPLSDDEIVVAQAAKAPKSVFCNTEPPEHNMPQDDDAADKTTPSQPLRRIP